MWTWGLWITFVVVIDDSGHIIHLVWWLILTSRGIHMVLLYVLPDNVNFLPSQPVTVRYMFRRHFPKCGRLFTEYMTVFTLLAARVTCQDNYLVNLKSFISRIVVYILSYVCHAFLRIHILTYGTCMCIYYHLW